ncbi:flagellar assembly peptidoglycan hydrolase FlgJ [Oxalobacter sp. OttesenSCG-928-P03]|nr:flagellar assembly peptidoglycan hydrolase FlgJ [Oxalobacter sp. OttesenSCG-928-P03]
MSSMTENVSSSAQQIINTRNLHDIKAAANRDGNSPAAMKAAAQQFEALFISLILKSMRQSLPQDGLFNTQQTKLYTQLLDEEIAQQVSKQGLGLADQMLRQMVATGQLDAEETKPYLSKRRISASVDAYRGMAAGSASEQASGLLSGRHSIFRSEGKAAEAVTRPGEAQMRAITLPGVESPGKAASASGHVKAFTDQMMPHAEKASKTTGIPPEFMLAQAALETGWGKKQMLHPDGSPSHNLFGIKANNWNGKTVDVLTSEFENGKMIKKVEKFRAYDSYADSFRDYAKLLSENPRYEKVMNAQDPATFAYGLQRAGYATDPEYGSKLVRVINKVSQG